MGGVYLLYGKHSKEDGFVIAHFQMGAATLRILLEKQSVMNNGYNGPGTVVNVNQTQITSVVNDISLQVLLNIDHSDLSEGKTRST